MKKQTTLAIAALVFIVSCKPKQEKNFLSFEYRTRDSPDPVTNDTFMKEMRNILKPLIHYVWKL
jgi:hypothetical protein